MPNRRAQTVSQLCSIEIEVMLIVGLFQWDDTEKEKYHKQLIKMTPRFFFNILNIIEYCFLKKCNIASFA